MINKICLYCKNEFMTVKRKVNEQKFCSRKCSDNAKIGVPSKRKGLKAEKVYKNKGNPRYNRRKQNKFIINDNIVTGIDSNDRKFYFDASFLEKVKQYCWNVKNNYVYSYTRESQEKRRQLLLHRLILNFPQSRVDHIDGNPINNLKSNLRLVSSSQNSINRKTNNKNGYSGVYKRKNGNYYSVIKQNYKLFYLGDFKTKKEAIEARKKAEIKMFGEYAYCMSRK